MGGIKNKLNKLSNKAKTLFANLASPSQGRRPTRRSLSGPEGLSNQWSPHASKTIGSLRLVTLTKYLSIACFTLVLISTIGLNLYRTYSNSNIETSAVGNSSSGGKLATQADIDPTSISLSITSSPSSSTGGNDANLSLSIPQGGGIATGRHTVTVETGSSVIGYDLMLSSDSEETSLVNSDNVDNEGNDSGSIISTTTGILTSPSQLADRTYGYTLANLDNDSSLANADIWIGLKPNTDPDTITTVDDSNLTIGQANTTSHNIYYGVNIQNPVETRAGNYTRQVVYTVVGELMPEPTVEDLVLNSSWTDDTPDTAYGSTSILTGQNLSGVTGVYIDLNDNETKDSGEEVANLTHGTGDEASTKLTFVAPTYNQEGQKNVYLEWGGGEPIKVKNGWNYIAPNKCTSNSAMSSCVIDVDDNMIPVIYTGDETDAEWTAPVPCSYGTGQGHPQYCSNLPAPSTTWFDYENGQWANAVTLRDDFKEGCYTYTGSWQSNLWSVKRIEETSQCGSTDSALTPLDFTKEILEKMDNSEIGDGRVEYDGKTLEYGWPIPEQDILGYWVYIPRYSYEVMRRDAIDLVQQPEDFKIKFETAGTAKKVPVEGCSNTNDPKSYRVGCGLNRTYTNAATDTTANTVTDTTWATHPAFTWMDADGNPVELNGFWVGKFETTGSAEEPTVLPDQKHLGVVDNGIGDYYDIAQSIGAEDKKNVYGNSAQTSYNNGKGYHNLSTTTSHMLKNSEWGAVAYLSASKYGAGVNKVQINNGYSDGDTGKGPNGGEYNTNDGQLASTTNSIYGIYDMAGGAWEYVMGGYTNDVSQSGTSYFSNAAKIPYVDLYPDIVFTNDDWYTSNNQCTWVTCGGHALHEAKITQTVSNGIQSWGQDGSSFVIDSNAWFGRGGNANDGIYAGLYYSFPGDGAAGDYNGFRIALTIN